MSAEETQKEKNTGTHLSSIQLPAPDDLSAVVTGGKKASSVEQMGNGPHTSLAAVANGKSVALKQVATAGAEPRQAGGDQLVLTCDGYKLWLRKEGGGRKRLEGGQSDCTASASAAVISVERGRQKSLLKTGRVSQRMLEAEQAQRRACAARLRELIDSVPVSMEEMKETVEELKQELSRAERLSVEPALRKEGLLFEARFSGALPTAITL